MSLREMVALLKELLPEEGRLMWCEFRGDPAADTPGKWRSRVLTDVDQIDHAANVYFCVSAMKRNDRGEFRRRKENFCGGLGLMIDDLGDGAAAKFPLSTLDPARPTALIETSPNNFQAFYAFSTLVTDEAEFSALINAFILAQFLGKDPGMAGVNRVFRPPAGVNGKPKHNGWRVRLAQWNPECRYTPAQLAEAFGLTLKRAGPPVPRGATVDTATSIRNFLATRALLRSAGMLRGADSNMAGWQEMRCPWTDDHTGRIDNGAAIRTPDADNGFVGAFRCHHGTCHERRWRDLTQWVSEQCEFILEEINHDAPPARAYRLR